MVIYDNGEVKVEVEETACITVMGSKPIYITLKELADIAGAVVNCFKTEPFFTEEDLEAGHQAIADYIAALPKGEA